MNALMNRRYDELTADQIADATQKGEWLLVEYAYSVQNVPQGDNHLIVTRTIDSDYSEQEIVPVDIKNGQIVRAGDGAFDAQALRWELEEYGITINEL